MGHRHNRNMREFRDVFFPPGFFCLGPPNICGVESFETEGATVAMVDWNHWNHKTMDPTDPTALGTETRRSVGCGRFGSRSMELSLRSDRFAMVIFLVCLSLP